MYEYYILLKGPLLRRAVTATVREAVTAELEGRKKSTAVSVKLIEELSGVYGAEDHVPAGALSRNAAEKKKEMNTSTPGGNRTKSRGSVMSGALPGQSTGPPKKTMVGVSSSDWVSNEVAANATIASLPKHEGLNEKPTQYSVKIVPGQSLLLDIPKGLDDTAENLLRASALRSYVPEFFPNHTPKVVSSPICTSFHDTIIYTEKCIVCNLVL